MFTMSNPFDCVIHIYMEIFIFLSREMICGTVSYSINFFLKLNFLTYILMFNASEDHFVCSILNLFLFCCCFLYFFCFSSYTFRIFVQDLIAMHLVDFLKMSLIHLIISSLLSFIICMDIEHWNVLLSLE